MRRDAFVWIAVLSCVFVAGALSAPSEGLPSLVRQYETYAQAVGLSPSGASAIASVDFGSIGEVRLLSGIPQYGFSTVNPITNDKDNLMDVVVLPGGGIRAVGGNRLWLFESGGVGRRSVVIAADGFATSVAQLNASQLLVAVWRPQLVVAPTSFVVTDLDGNVLGAWGPQVRANYGEQRADIAVAASGNVYLSLGEDCRVVKCDALGNVLQSWGQRGTGEGDLFFPCAIAVDPAENVYVADNGNDRIVKFSSNGTFKVSWGGRPSSYPSPAISVEYPYAVACMPEGTIAVSTRARNAQNAGTVMVRFYQPAVLPVGNPRTSWTRVKALYRAR